MGARRNDQQQARVSECASKPWQKGETRLALLGPPLLADHLSRHPRQHAGDHVAPYDVASHAVGLHGLARGARGVRVHVDREEEAATRQQLGEVRDDDAGAGA